MTNRKTRYILIQIFLFVSVYGYSQLDNTDKNAIFLQRPGSLTLRQAIQLAKEQSAEARMAKLSFLGNYWSYRSYKAELLPSLRVYGDLGEYNRSIVEVRDPNSGKLSYVENNSLNNSLHLSLEQNIVFLGGKLSFNSRLSRLDQFRYDKTTYYSNPFTFNYTQPLRAFNELKWKKKTEPLEYEKAKKKYLETMQSITLRTNLLFFSVLTSQSNYRKSLETYKDRKRLFEIAKKRNKLGTTGKSELLQLELSLLNSEMAINTQKLSLENQLFSFSTYLGLKTNKVIELIDPGEVPNIEIKVSSVEEKAVNNSSYSLKRKLTLLNSEKELARAKSLKGLQADLHANLGFSQTGEEIHDAYTNLINKEVVGFRLSMPIFDWGMSKGKVRMAKARLDVVKAQLDIEEMEFLQNIRTTVIKFNNQAKQCNISVRARDIAKERYQITKKRFENATVTVTELNTAQNEMDNAQYEFINQLRIFWNLYYEIQKLTLFDYINNVDLSAEFDEIIEN